MIRQLAAVKDVTYLVKAMIVRLEHGKEVDISAVLLRSAAAREDANRFIDAMISQHGCAMERRAAEERRLPGQERFGGCRPRCRALEDRES